MISNCYDVFNTRDLLLVDQTPHLFSSVSQSVLSLLFNADQLIS